MGSQALEKCSNVGFDHGVGHPLLLLCNAKAPNCRKNKALKDLGHYSEWPKVADAVIKAKMSIMGFFVGWSCSRGGRQLYDNSTTEALPSSQILAKVLVSEGFFD
jgi:hypothetical protein